MNLQDKIENVIKGRGYEIEDILSPKQEPFLKNLKECVDFICNIKNRPIHIVGDYDCDGICSTIILVNTLNRVGFAPTWDIPYRFTDGYGLSDRLCDLVPDNSVLILVDNGIASVEQVDNLKTRGIDTIIIDHHLKKEDGKVPNTLIIDPHIENESEFKDYCGAGLSLRFAKELLSRLNEDTNRLVADLTVYAAIATVADVVPMLFDNRNIVKQGLEYMNMGIMSRELYSLVSALNKEEYTESDFGFLVAPCINSVSRLYDKGGEMMVDFFLGKLFCKLTPEKIIETNNERKAYVEKYLKEAVCDGKTPIVLDISPCPDGILGIIAGKLCEKYNMPAIVFSYDFEKDMYKGSGRSTDTVHLKHLLDCVKEYIVKYGGHPKAAGLSVKDFGKFKEAVTTAFSEMHSNYNPETDVKYDIEISEKDVKEAIDITKQYAPYGEDFKPIIFKITDFKEQSRKIMGANQNHIKLKGEYVEAVKFFIEEGEKTFLPVGVLSENVFRGNRTPQLELV